MVEVEEGRLDRVQEGAEAFFSIFGFYRVNTEKYKRNA